MAAEGGGGCVGVVGKLQVSTTAMEEEDLAINDGTSPMQVIYVSSSTESPSSNNNNKANTSNPSAWSFDCFESKSDVIRACLQLHQQRPAAANNSQVVDLWELRQLALSRGGLLSPSLRRLAWPLLMGVASDDTDADKTEEETAMTAIMDFDDKDKVAQQEAMDNDINQTVWSIEALVRQSQSGKDSFWYVPPQQQQQQPSVALDEQDAAPGLALSSPCSNSSSDHSSTDHHHDDANSSTTTHNGEASVLPTKEEAVAAIRLTAQERVLLQQVLEQALVQDHQLLLPLQPQYYPAGGCLSNLAALLLINLESSSSSTGILAARLLSQLSKYPLQAALRGAVGDADHLEGMLSVLLARFQRTTTTTKSAVTTDLVALTTTSSMHGGGCSLQVASRILDACMVSHSLFFLYLGAAMLHTAATTNASTHSDASSWTMQGVEDAIAAALNYMDDFPPADLLAATSKTTSFALPTPAWALAATSLLQQQPQEEEETVVSPPSSSVFTQQVQQESPFSDDATDANWERLSLASIVSDDDFVMEYDENDEPVAPPQETHFLASYPLAVTAAGLSAASTKSRQTRKQQRAAGRFRSTIILRVLFAMAIGAALAAAWSLGDMSSVFAAMMSSQQQKYSAAPVSRRASLPTLLPSNKPVASATLVPSFRSRRSIMVREGSKSSVRMTSDSEELLQKYMLDGLVHSMGLEPYVNASVETLREWTSTVAPNQQAVATPPKKLKILRPLVRQLQKLGRFCKKIASFVLRGNKKKNQA